MSIRPKPDSKLVQQAHRATLVTFFLAGFCLASFLSRIPTIRDLLAFTPAQMGQLLLVGSVGSVVWLPVSGPLVARWGPRLIIWSAFSVWTAGLLGIALTFQFLAGSPTASLALAISLFIFQAGTALWNSTMNVEGGYVENLAKRPVMPQYHALFSLGTVTAASLGAVLLHFSVSLPGHLLGVGVIAGILIIWAGHNYLPGEIFQSSRSVEATKITRKAWKERNTILIGLMVLGTGLMEGAANDWLSLAMVDGFSLTQTMGTVCLAVYLTVLTIFRLGSPVLITWWGPVKLLRCLLLGASAGLIMLALSPWVGIALIGIIFWAGGSALGFPLAASALSREARLAPARMSVLSTIGYGAFLAGPPILGYIADFVGYRGALGFIVLPIFGSIYLAGQLEKK